MPTGVRPRTPWLMCASVVVVLGSSMLPATEPVVQIHSQTIVQVGGAGVAEKVAPASLGAVARSR